MFRMMSSLRNVFENRSDACYVKVVVIYDDVGSESDDICVGNVLVTLIPCFIICYYFDVYALLYDLPYKLTY